MLLKTREAAELLGVPPERVKKWVRANYVPHLRVGRAVYFHRDVLLRWASGDGRRWQVQSRTAEQGQG